MKTQVIAALMVAAPIQVAPSRDLPLPDDIALLCLDSTNTYQPIQDTDYGRLKHAFMQQFGFNARLMATSATSGTLIFKGGQGGAETVSYIVRPRTDGMALLSMRVRLHGVTENLKGNEMCWRTFAIINVE